MPGIPGSEVFALLQAGEIVLSRDMVAELGRGGGRGVQIGQLVVQSSAPPRAWMEETLWRVAG